MADKKPFKISQLDSMTSADLDGADLFLVSDVKDGNATYRSKKLTYDDLVSKTGAGVAPIVSGVVSAAVVPTVSAAVMPAIIAEESRAISAEDALSKMPIETDRLVQGDYLIHFDCGTATTVMY